MIGAIIQARLGSTRFPGKIIEPLWRSMGSLEIMIQKLQNENIPVVVATSKKNRDDIIIKLCKKLWCAFYRGSEENVLSRVLCCAKKFDFDTIIDLTSDCPLLDVKLLNKMIKKFKNSDINYLSNCLVKSYADGYDIQIYKRNTLNNIYKKEEYYQEHSGFNVIFNLERIHIDTPAKEFYHPDWGLTLDTREDLELLKKIYNHFDRLNFTYNEVCEYIIKNPGLLNINNHVKRKTAGE